MVNRRLRVLTVVLAAVLAASGCAREAGTGESTGAPAPAPPSGAASPAVPSVAAPSQVATGTTKLPATDLPGQTAPGAAGAKTISGTVTAGVEPDCLLLSGGGTEHLLIFDDPALRAAATPGATVTVTGQAQPGQVTTCQQGVPFFVTAVQPD